MQKTIFDFVERNIFVSFPGIFLLNHRIDLIVLYPSVSSKFKMMLM